MDQQNQERNRQGQSPQGQGPFECKACNQTFGSNEELQNHNRTYHQPTGKESESGAEHQYPGSGRSAGAERNPGMGSQQGAEQRRGPGSQQESGQRQQGDFEREQPRKKAG